MGKTEKRLLMAVASSSERYCAPGVPRMAEGGSPKKVMVLPGQDILNGRIIAELPVSLN